MTVIATAVKHLMAAGVTGDALLKAIAELEAATQPKRTRGAERTARWRAKKDETSQSVTVTNVTECDAPRAREDIYINNTQDLDNKTHTLTLSQNQTAGEKAVAVMRSLRDIPDHAGQLHRAVADALCEAGFDARCEASTAHLGDDRDGRVDILATLDGGTVVIEIDARKPRNRSLKKLRLFNAYRIVGLRGVEMQPPEGIDAVVGLHVVAVEKHELEDFQEFYDAYPRHVARGTAEKAWPAAVRAAGSSKVICDAARAFRRLCAGKDETYIPHPASWLNAKRWEDAGVRLVTAAVQAREIARNVAVMVDTPAWEAWKRTGRRFNPVDIKDNDGHVIGRGWYFPSEYPHQEQAA